MLNIILMYLSPFPSSQAKGTKFTSLNEVNLRGAFGYGQVQIRIHIVGARIYQTIISKVLNISD